MNYAGMTVKELREESKKRGMTLEYKGKKFTKSELIARLEEDDKNNKTKCSDEENEVWDTGEERPEEQGNKDVCEDKETEEPKEVRQDKIEDYAEIEEKSEKPDEYIKFAKTFDEIVKKYSGRKKQRVYDEELKVGSFVVFIHYVEAKDHEIYKKLRTAKVVGINRKKELVRVQTLLGTELELIFDDLLYVKGAGKECDYPKDITVFLKKRRTQKGRELINERLGKEVVAD